MMSRTYIVCALLFAYMANAQYNGGSDDGNDWSILTGSRLNGTTASFSILYQGSHGDGFDVHEQQLLLTNSSFNIYDGNLGDGFSQNIAILTIAGNNINNLYKGNVGDGATNDQIQGILSGKDITVLFFGNNGDGANNALSLGLLLEGFMSDLFKGGDGDGFASVLEPNNYLTGIMLALFNGGHGDGFSVNNFTSALTLDLVEKLIELDVVLYPNPATDIVNLKLPNSINITKIEVIDVNGRPVRFQLINKHTIDISNLPSGIYLVNIQSENNKGTKKLIVH
ncbi:hypothetical protein MHTCC0001_18580 [Flavobacteriaceae bacterium MHTCC 0001]